MTKEFQAVRDGAAVTTVPLTVKQIRQIAAGAFANRLNDRFKTLHQVEHRADRNNVPTTGTVLQPIVEALNAGGVPTQGTIGGVLKSLQISFDTLHAYTCNCVNEGDIPGSRAAINFANIANM